MEEGYIDSRDGFSSSSTFFEKVEEDSSIRISGYFTNKENLYITLEEELPDVLVMMVRLDSMYHDVRIFLKNYYPDIKLLSLVDKNNEYKIRQQGLLKMQGSAGTKTQEGVIVKEKSGVSAERIATVPAFKIVKTDM